LCVCSGNFCWGKNFCRVFVLIAVACGCICVQFVITQMFGQQQLMYAVYLVFASPDLLYCKIFCCQSLCLFVERTTRKKLGPIINIIITIIIIIIIVTIIITTIFSGSGGGSGGGGGGGGAANFLWNFRTK